jgi:hypothetical protein
MSAPKDGEPGPGTPPQSQGVLSNLPRTRPQRSTPRRTAAREAMAAARAPSTAPPDTDGRPAPGTRDDGASVAQGRTRPSAAGGAGARRARSPRGATGRTAGRPRTGEPVPRQGFEAEGERANGPVQPPGGAELIASAAEVVSELAKAGLSTGERLFRDVLSRLPLS